MTYRLLVIDDEFKTTDSLKKGLEEKGYLVQTAYDGETAVALAGENKFDLVIMDVMLPGMSGLDICKVLRERNDNTPVIMLTALGMTADKLRGFDVGSDDYIVKPFDFEELLARIRVALSRNRRQSETNQLVYGDVVMDLDKMEVTRNGLPVSLTAKEYALLEYFLRNPEKVISKDAIAENVWDLTFDTGTNFVEVYVSYLRNKIDRNFEEKLIHTRKGMGYILRRSS